MFTNYDMERLAVASSSSLASRSHSHEKSIQREKLGFTEKSKAAALKYTARVQIQPKHKQRKLSAFSSDERITNAFQLEKPSVFFFRIGNAMVDLLLEKNLIQHFFTRSVATLICFFCFLFSMLNDTILFLL